MSGRGRNLVYEFGQWQIHLNRRQLLAGGVAVPIGGRAFEIIEVLVQSANHLVTKNEILDRVWPGVTIGENALQVHISAIRKAFGPDRAMLQTVSGRGYRLLGQWTPRQLDGADTPVAAAPVRQSWAVQANNIPAAITPLIGRAVDARHVRDLVSAWRVVTLTGPGGIGKTALALDVAHSVRAEFDGGGCFVELASLSDPGLVPAAVAGALGLRLDDEVMSAADVARAVGGQNLLLVLDNCEHVIDAVANLTETVTRLCPRTTILATSREVLRVAGEYVYRIPPLDVPASEAVEPEQILSYSAVQLFISKTTAHGAEFPRRAEDILAIAAICRRLDSIPLAIEFAAARAATLGIPRVTIGLNDRFTLLKGERRTALPRHQTLRATLDWSYGLLSATERLLLRRLAVFSAGFTLDAALAVVRDTDLDAAAVMSTIANLVTKSLVTVEKSDAAAASWSLLETIRAYALEKLDEHAETSAAARYYAKYCNDSFVPPAPGGEVR